MVISTTIAAVAMMIVLFFVMLFAWIDYKNNLYDELNILAQIIGDNNSANIMFASKPDAAESLSTLRANQNIEKATIYSAADSTIFASYLKDSSAFSPDFSEVKFGFPLNYTHTEHMKVTRAVMLKGELIAHVYIESNLKMLKQSMLKFILVGLGVFLVAIIIAFLIATYLQSLISKPILNLAKATKRVSEEKNYDLKVSSLGKDEIGSLTESFNDMLAQIKTQNEDLIEAKNRAETSEKAKELFLANVSHEFRTPLNAIVGLSDLLEEASKPNPEYLQGIASSSKQLLALVNDILDLSKIESGKLQFEAIPFSLQTIFEECYYTSQYHAMQKEIDLGFAIDNSIRSVVGDPTRLKQVLINLLSNAIKFTEKGSVHFSVQVQEKRDKSVQLLFNVQDTGIGIPPEKQGAIFEDFSQVDSSTSRLYGGTGLGLSICKNIVSMQGGEIWVESTVGKGSSFNFTLSFELSDQDPVHVGVEQLYFKDLHVLCVDDYKLNLTILTKMLSAHGIQCSTAANGQQAVDMVVKHNYDMIFMDIQMPVLDGVEATKQIRALKTREKNSIAIVALTANARSFQKQAFMDAGMNSYLTKPYQKEEILQLLSGSFSDKIVAKPVKPILKGKSISTPKNQKQTSLDIEHLKNMMSGDINVVHALLEQYKIELSDQLLEIQQVLDKEDFSNLKTIIHKIKPAVSYLNVQSLLELFKEEVHKKAVDDAQLKDYVSSVEQSLALLIDKISEYLKSS